jgi:hypothetical protein
MFSANDKKDSRPSGRGALVFQASAPIRAIRHRVLSASFTVISGM